MYILTFTKQGSDFVDLLCRESKDMLLKDSLSYFDGFVKSGDQFNFNQDDLLELVKFIVDPPKKGFDIPRIKLGLLHFSLVDTQKD